MSLLFFCLVGIGLLEHHCTHVVVGNDCNVCVFLHWQGHFSIAEGLFVTGKSPEAVKCLCREILQCATYYHRLSDFAQPRQPSSLEEFGLVTEAFRSGLGRFLQHYRAFILALPKSSLTLLWLSTMLRKVVGQIRYVSFARIITHTSVLRNCCDLLSPYNLFVAVYQWCIS